MYALLACGYASPTGVCFTATSPSEHVQQLLQVPEGEEDDRLEAHDIFCEMSELRPVFDGAEYEWRETARSKSTYFCEIHILVFF
jgi:hypothetical protein